MEPLKKGLKEESTKSIQQIVKLLHKYPILNSPEEFYDFLTQKDRHLLQQRAPQTDLVELQKYHDDLKVLYEKLTEFLKWESTGDDLIYIPRDDEYEHFHLLVPPKPYFNQRKWKETIKNDKARLHSLRYIGEDSSAFDNEHMRYAMQKFLGLSEQDIKTLFDETKKYVLNKLNNVRKNKKISKAKKASYEDEISEMKEPTLGAVDRLLHIYDENEARSRKIWRRIWWGGKIRRTRARRINAQASRRLTRSSSRRFGATRRAHR